jgi:hypothetical protein
LQLAWWNLGPFAVVDLARGRDLADRAGIPAAQPFAKA